MGLNAAIQERVEAMEITDPLTKQINIKMCGCPNGCGQHHIGTIGFYGASIKVGEHTIPAYIPHVGGNFENDDVVFGKRLKLRLPAKRVPEAVERWMRFYEAERNEGEEFNAFAERVGTEKFEESVKDLTLPIEFNLENLNSFIDWSRARALPGRSAARANARSSGETTRVAPHADTRRRSTPRRSRPTSRTPRAEEALAWAAERFPNLSIACSFQKTTSVTIDMASRVAPDARFFYLDTDVLFAETYETRDRLAARYGIEFERVAGISLDEQARLYGDALWARQPDACCGIRKVEPMREALSGEVDCWVSGIRRADSESRAGAEKFGWDVRFGLWKLNPLADWTERDVWNHINEHDVPYNPLHDEGYPSIGCTHCTRPPAANGGARSGRWANADKTECGLNG